LRDIDCLRNPFVVMSKPRFVGHDASPLLRDILSISMKS
jgi:hypothetical protein